MASHKKAVFSTEDLISMAQQSIARSRVALQDFRLMMQDVEERQVEVRSRRVSRLSPVNDQDSVQRVSQLPLGNLPDDPSMYELFNDADFAYRVYLASRAI